MKNLVLSNGIIFENDEGKNTALDAKRIYDLSEKIKELGLKISRFAISPIINFRYLNKKIVIELVVCKKGNEYLVTLIDNHFLDYILIENTIYYLNYNFEFLNCFLIDNVVNVKDVSLFQYLSLKRQLLKNGQILNDYVKNELDNSRTYSPSKILDFEINGKLFEYQNVGFNWLAFMYKNNCGAILADEMGLGKTLQVISLMAFLRHMDNEANFLVICPLSLLENWKREIKKFSPNLSVLVHHGSNRTGSYKVLKNYNVIITSYSNAQSDLSMFNMVNWDLVIVDEAQNIKNPYANRTKFIKQIKSKCSIAVTGTPFENHMDDIWSIVDFIMPNYFGTLSEFEKEYGDDLNSAELLEPYLSPLMIRRRFNDVAKDLPNRIDIPQPIIMEEQEAVLYESNREKALQSLNELKIEKIQKLRMFCTHPYVYNQEYSNCDPITLSSKYQRLCEIVEEIAMNQEKVLIFTSFNRMNSLLTSDLKKRFSIMTYSITGETDVEDRQKIIDEFTKCIGTAALILNPKAAGAGLNITAANHVIHYNLEWNPAVEDQASARAYRRGQSKTVFIYRLFYKGTIEEIINDKIEQKRELSNAAIVGNDGNMNEDDLEKALNISPLRRDN